MNALKTHNAGKISHLSWGMLVMLVVVASGSAQSASTNVPPVPAIILSVSAPRPQSLFLMDHPKGKDPFFPDSTRRVMESARTNAATVAVRESILNQLVLKGIIYSKTQPLALINNVTLAVGEKARIKMNGEEAVIRCLAIREKSVVLGMEGSKEVKELKLRRGL